MMPPSPELFVGDRTSGRSGDDSPAGHTSSHLVFIGERRSMAVTVDRTVAVST